MFFLKYKYNNVLKTLFQAQVVPKLSTRNYMVSVVYF